MAQSDEALNTGSQSSISEDGQASEVETPYIIQGTTPMFELLLPSEVDMNVRNMVFTISQSDFVKNGISVSKSLRDKEIEIKNNTIYVQLNQLDTLRLVKGVAAIMLNWSYSDGTRGCSEEIHVEVRSNLFRGVVI